MLQLSPKYVTIVREILAQHTPRHRVLAFGSRASGRSHDGSDLDLVVINPDNPELPTPDCALLREAFSESDLPMTVDVLDWAQIPASFRAEIDNSPYVTLQSGIKGSGFVLDDKGQA